MSALLSRLLTNLDMAVLARDQQGTFALLNEPPSWLAPLWPETKAKREQLDPAGPFLFIENFLNRAASFWQTPNGEALNSGIWTETDEAGQDHLLEATAMVVDETPMLLIEKSEKQGQTHIYQRAREQRLEYENLVEEINKREVLLHCIVHDLSNPLAGIRGSLKLLSTEAEVDSDGTELLRIGMNQADKMQHLIRSILTSFSEEVSGLLPTLVGSETAPDLAKSTATILEALQASASLKGVALALNPVDALDHNWQVIGEPDRLERVLFNLVMNAIRHTPAHEGRTVHVHLSDETRYRKLIVEDEGSGVPASQVNNLFTRFGQGEGENGLAGLGLYFCKITVESWGGHIGYEAGPNGGARFWFSLPKPLNQLDTAPTTPSPS